MVFHENRLLADYSHEISYLIFSKIRKDVEKFAVCCSRDWRFKRYSSALDLYNFWKSTAYFSIVSKYTLILSRCTGNLHLYIFC